MSAEVKAQIAVEISKIVRVVDFPAGPFAYGSDISGAEDVDPSMREVNGGTQLALAQALVRRVDCPRGALPDDKNYGRDLRSYLNRGVTQSQIASLEGELKGEWEKDDRVDVATVRVALLSANAIDVIATIQPVDGNGGPFTLTLNASSASVLLGEIRSLA